jgi:putative redox protein
MAMLENVRALWTEIQERKTMPRSVFVHSGSLRYDQNISVGSHVLQADEPSDYGGNDVGPIPYELLLAALGACTSMTVQMYAERKQWPLRGVQVSLSYAKVHAQDCAECETKVGMVDRIKLGISFTGDLSEEQQRRLLEIANKCPVHRTLVSRVHIDARLLGADSPPQ